MNMCARRQPKRKVQNKGGGGGLGRKEPVCVCRMIETSECTN